ncbi:MAG: adenylate/guanylate cyclase domain-containing protein [Casimicrobiaceae bacterium]
MERLPPDPDTRASGEACRRIRDALAQGAPWDACDAFRAAIVALPSDPELLYSGALAHARAGATREAHALLDRAQAGASLSPHLLGEIRSLRGRLWKDHLHRHPDAPDAATFAERARRDYLAAYALQGAPYPGINAATMSMVLGDRTEARRLAAEVAGRLAAQTSARTCWDYATEGEAKLLLGQIDAARECYAAAVALVPGDVGSVSTMRRQVKLLARTIPDAADVLEVLPATDVVAFAGHMIDAPGRGTPRFPAALAPAVQATLRAELARFHSPIVYSSAACGADLIFIEAALAIGAEVNVVLPFDRLDFIRTSVAIGGAGWVERFDAALDRATRVIYATEEGYLDDDVLFDYAAMLLEGLASLRATQLETAPTLLCVFDADAAGRVGGTHSSFERWRRNVGPPQVIDLRALRERAGSAALSVAGTETIAPSSPQLANTEARPHRTLKTLLFADFAGFSRLHDAFAPLFQTRFLDIVAREIAAAPVKPLDSKTWGDGLYIVFESPEDGAEFALRLQASMLAVDWKAAGLSETSQIRIALHAGPVFRGYDPIVKRDGFFGSSVTRTARIEPVTPPGMVYTSEAFAATLTASGQRDDALEYVGRLALAKGYGESRIYRLERR